jgi:hypothetical protein
MDIQEAAELMGVEESTLSLSDNSVQFSEILPPPT